jgi:uncharacterized protein (TIGR00725 family)
VSSRSIGGAEVPEPGAEHSSGTGRRRLYVAVVGPGDDAPAGAVADAMAIGRLLAAREWITLTGGRAAGVMGAAAAGATAAGGLAIGILPGTDRSDAAPAPTVALPTGLGEARNAVLVTAADAVVGCGLSPGTVSELALALRTGRPTVLVRPTGEAAAFFAALGGAPLHIAASPDEAIAWLEARVEAHAADR